jgi:2-dehydropantoate 2-reductase
MRSRSALRRVSRRAHDRAMKFLIFGAGAMGSLIGGLLSTRHDVTLVARKPHVDAIRTNGLSIRGRTQLTARPRAVERAEEAVAPEVVVITVKSYDTEDALQHLRPFWRSATFLSLQNGLGNVEKLAAGAQHVLGGVTYQGVTFVGPGVVNHAGVGDTILGPYVGASLAAAHGIAHALVESGLATTVTGDVEPVLWTKAVVNACFNPLTGLLRVRSGAVAKSDHLMECCRMIVEEAAQVARACGTPIDVDALMERVRAVSHATAENRSSMLQDLERGRRTEIDAINGWISRLGAERRIPTPVNRALTVLVKAAEELGAGRA